jgi:predicted enzyme related to lactoylglutathione lyase
MARVAHFEIHADDPQRAINFYSTLFGWEFQQWGGQEYWLIKTGSAEEPGIDGGLVRRRGDRPQIGQAVNAYVCTVLVNSLDETIAAVDKGGGTVALAKMPVPGVGWLAYFHDPEGNIFGVMQNDPDAQ